MHDPYCKGCEASVRLAPGEVQRILEEYLQDHSGSLVDDAVYQQRLTICRDCPDLQYSTTCRFCGCLVEVRAKLADQGCPGVPAKWGAVAG